MVTSAAKEQDLETATVSSPAKPRTLKPRGKPFVPGDSRINRLGGPKKGESLPEKLKRRVEKDSDKIVEAVYKRLIREDSVGNRAFVDVRDTVYGIPKQHLVLEQADSPLLAFLTKHIDVSRETMDVIEGESRLLPEGQGE